MVYLLKMGGFSMAMLNNQMVTLKEDCGPKFFIPRKAANESASEAEPKNSSKI
jgi:hypothetical protein